MPLANATVESRPKMSHEPVGMIGATFGVPFILKIQNACFYHVKIGFHATQSDVFSILPPRYTLDRIHNLSDLYLFPYPACLK